MNKKRNFIEVWHKSSITIKIFLTTSLLLIMLSLFIYFSLYFFLPSFYESHKINRLEKEIHNLIEETADFTLRESIMPLDDFSHQHNVEMLLFSPDGIAIQNFPIYPTPISEINFRRVFPQLGIWDDVNLFSELWTPLESWQALEMWQTVEMWNQDTERHVNFTNYLDEYVLVSTITLQPVDEVSDILFLFIPYIVGIILIFTIISVSFYSKMITKPLLQINNLAKKMANLDFNETCTVNSEDEIGQISLSLNQMSSNLQKSLKELKNANIQLKSDIQKKQEAEKKRTEFVATISHELKTPITAVKGQLEAMIYNIGPYKDHDKYLRRSYKIMSDMDDLVKDVLNVSKWEYYEPQNQHINLADLVRTCSDNLDYFYKQKDINLTLELEEVTTWVDPSLIRRAIGNVMNNAVKYSPQDAIIHISLTIQNQHPVLRIFNSGNTISESELDKIFEPFYRLEKSRNRDTGGSGLGLYIVQQILDLHHVKYEIKNTEEGVAFTMIFPKITNNSEIQ